MSELLLFLVLLADGTPHEVGDQLMQTLSERAGSRQIQVLDGEAARAVLVSEGVEAEDLLASPAIGRALTAGRPWVIIHLDQRQTMGDRILSARLWFQGRHESQVSIAGGDEDPLPGLIHGVSSLLSPVLQTPGAASGETLAALVQRGAWQEVLGRLAEKEDRSPREWYFLVLAYARLENRDAAVEALNAMRAAHPDHVLVSAATGMIPARSGADADLHGIGRTSSDDASWLREDRADTASTESDGVEDDMAPGAAADTASVLVPQ
jgi:hypothetical protein